MVDMTWFRKPKTKLQGSDRRDLPGDVWEKCPACGEIVYRQKLQENWAVCPECAFHMRLGAPEYIQMLLDEGTFVEHDAGMRSGDPLDFVDLKAYPDRLAQAEKRTGRGDALIAGRGELDGLPVHVAIMDFSFIGGSMGSVVGEKIARSGMRALEEGTPFMILSASGGARMMEGIFSLMQMAKTSSVLAKLHEAGLPYVSILTDPTTGGVTASYAMLGDVNISEPGALIGFAGPRVIEQTIKQALPEGFQRAEFLLEHGMLDLIVDRRDMKREIARLLRHMRGLPPTSMRDEENGASSEA
jgi:acetyl-CoA carboxylase carboxyl transferase subunit beta